MKLQPAVKIRPKKQKKPKNFKVLFKVKRFHVLIQNISFFFLYKQPKVAMFSDPRSGKQV